MDLLNTAKLQSIALTLENDQNFYRAYCAQSNRETTNSASGASCSAARRSVIKQYARELANSSTSMLEVVRLEKYFNERYELCPYGLGLEPTELVPASAPTPEPEPEPKLKEDTMATINTTLTLDTSKIVRVETFIYGRRASEFSDTEIFGRIAGIESRIAELKNIKATSKKLTREIAVLEAEIATLVKFVDDRDPT